MIIILDIVMTTILHSKFKADINMSSILFIKCQSIINIVIDIWSIRTRTNLKHKAQSGVHRYSIHLPTMIWLSFLSNSSSNKNSSWSRKPTVLLSKKKRFISKSKSNRKKRWSLISIAKNNTRGIAIQLDSKYKYKKID